MPRRDQQRPPLLASAEVGEVSDLIDMMVPPVLPIWRNGATLPLKPWVPSEQGDLQWMAHDYRDHRKGGRWYCYAARDRIWVCLDPYDQSGINHNSDMPPIVDAFGRLCSQ